MPPGRLVLGGQIGDTCAQAIEGRLDLMNVPVEVTIAASAEIGSSPSAFARRTEFGARRADQ